MFLGGCSSYGHSCFGGHGKRSHDNGIDFLGLKYVNPRTKLSPEDVINLASTGPYQVRESYKPLNKNWQILLRNLVIYKNWIYILISLMLTSSTDDYLNEFMHFKLCNLKCNFQISVLYRPLATSLFE